jgi:hypothetical protein
MFDAKSRYKDLPIKTHVDAGGRERRYVARRFLPDPANLRPLARLRVTDSDRLDLMAHRYLGESTVFWRIADANAAMHPDDLLSPAGRQLIVPSPI